MCEYTHDVNCRIDAGSSQMRLVTLRNMTVDNVAPTVGPVFGPRCDKRKLCNNLVLHIISDTSSNGTDSGTIQQQ